MVKLDPVLFSIVHKKGEDNYDSLSWDEVFKRFASRTSNKIRMIKSYLNESNEHTVSYSVNQCEK